MATPIADEHIDKLMRRTISPLAKLKRNIFDNSAVRFIFHMMLLFLASIAALRQNLTLDAPARSATQEYCSLLFPSYCHLAHPFTAKELTQLGWHMLLPPCHDVSFHD